jgi:mannose-1-phosphate guanylyltransferase
LIAMLLAAGLGTRMAPLSARVPKPALPILDEPILLALVRTLAAEGVSRCVVNAHAHPETMRLVLARAPIPVELSLEPTLLGSGGGIAAARRWLDHGEPFLVLNADMWLDLGLAGLRAAHAAARRRGARATLALRDEPRKQEFGSLGYDARGFVRRITQLVDRGGEVASGLFAGMHLIEPILFRQLPARETFDIVRDVYVPWLREDGCALAAWPMPLGLRWEPVGTPRELLEVNLAALARVEAGRCISSDARIDAPLAPPVFVGARARVERGARVGPQVVLGQGALVRAGTRLRRALVLPGARPPAGASLERVVCYDEEVWCDA